MNHSWKCLCISTETPELQWRTRRGSCLPFSICSPSLPHRVEQQIVLPRSVHRIAQLGWCSTDNQLYNPRSLWINSTFLSFLKPGVCQLASEWAKNQRGDGESTAAWRWPFSMYLPQKKGTVHTALTAKHWMSLVQSHPNGNRHSSVPHGTRYQTGPLTPVKHRNISSCIFRTRQLKIEFPINWKNVSSFLTAGQRWTLTERNIFLSIYLAS